MLEQIQVNEELIGELIMNSGEARSLAMESIQLARKGNFDEADTLITQSRQASNEAHKVQTQLIGLDEGEGKVQTTLIIVHAQDHLMCSMLCRDLAEEFIELHKKISTLQNKG